MDLVLSNERFSMPAAPNTWIQLHKVATGTSLAAGAIAYSLTHLSGMAATSVVVHSINIGGSIFAHAGRLIAGDIVGLGIQSGTRSTAYIVEQAGNSATMIGSLLASTAAAVTVGSAFLVGNTLYDIYKNCFISKPIPEMEIVLVESIEELEPDYIVYQLEDMPIAQAEEQEQQQVEHMDAVD